MSILMVTPFVPPPVCSGKMIPSVHFKITKKEIYLPHQMTIKTVVKCVKMKKILTSHGGPTTVDRLKRFEGNLSLPLSFVNNFFIKISPRFASPRTCSPIKLTYHQSPFHHRKVNKKKTPCQSTPRRRCNFHFLMAF